MALKIISAGAGSGKTYRLTEELVTLLATGQARASNIIATTFTEKAAAELRERVRVKLLERNMMDAANELPNALIGTVHSVGTKLLRRFAFEAGVSPLLEVVPDGDFQILFNRSLSTIITTDIAERMETLVMLLGLERDRKTHDWRRDVRDLTDLARGNDITPAMWQYSRTASFSTLAAFFGQRSTTSAADWNRQLAQRLFETIEALESNGDATKTTSDVVAELRNQYRELLHKGCLPWPIWAKLGKEKPAKKSIEIFEPFKEWIQTHDQHPDFYDHIQEYIYTIFDVGERAIGAYEAYKKERGLIDYTDMEVLLKRLIGRTDIKNLLAEELDLLMVDEFQDTNPIQLDIFTQLSRLATHSVWVGDPKQSIYSFRGADPRLMQAVIDKSGGIRDEDILRESWRSRPDIVQFTNQYFTEAFNHMPPDQVTLSPRRTDEAAMSAALIHWNFEVIPDDIKRHPAKPWMEHCIAQSVQEMLKNPPIVGIKGGTSTRPAHAGDIAVLCSSNAECAEVAKALNHAGVKTAIARTGLMETAEATLVMACLRYLHTRHDALAAAEIQLFAHRKPIENILKDRLDFLQYPPAGEQTVTWAETTPILSALNEIRRTARDLSSVEVLNLLLEELDLRRIIASWGNMTQRLDNIEKIRQYALQYEQSCLRNHSAASLAGYLVWMQETARNNRDDQSATESSDTVRVLTYHKSKGLEFPITICHSLSKNTKDAIWGLHIEHSRTDLDLENVLDGLWIRFWINPYGQQSKKTPLVERIAESHYQVSAAAHALREDGRLLYVGITRARDYLIIPTAKDPARWFNRVYLHGQEDGSLLDSTGSTHAFDPLFFDIQSKQYPRHIEMRPTPNESLSYLQPRVGKQQPSFERHIIDLRQDANSIKARVAHVQLNEFTLAELPQEQPLSALAFRTLRGMFLADHYITSATERADIASTLSDRFLANQAIAVSHLERISQAWWNTIKQTFPHDYVHRLYPIRHYRGGRIFETAIELLLESNEQLTLIYMHPFPLAASAATRVRDVATWMLLTTEALQHIFPNRKVRQVVVFPLAGVWADVKIV